MWAMMLSLCREGCRLKRTMSPSIRCLSTTSPNLNSWAIFSRFPYFKNLAKMFFDWEVWFFFFWLFDLEVWYFQEVLVSIQERSAQLYLFIWVWRFWIKFAPGWTSGPLRTSFLMSSRLALFTLKQHWMWIMWFQWLFGVFVVDKMKYLPSQGMLRFWLRAQGQPPHRSSGLGQGKWQFCQRSPPFSQRGFLWIDLRYYCKRSVDYSVFLSLSLRCTTASKMPICQMPNYRLTTFEMITFKCQQKYNGFSHKVCQGAGVCHKCLDLLSTKHFIP